jgi:hypothetical protein
MGAQTATPRIGGEHDHEQEHLVVTLAQLIVALSGHASTLASA